MKKSIRSYLRSPLGRIFILVLVAILIYCITIWARGGFTTNLLEVFRDIGIFLLGLIFWLLCFSQFVLPVRRVHERFQAFFRLIIYLLGRHGAALFIENGTKKESDEEEQRSGPGVVLLDTSSAALLQTPTKFTRAVGPGVAFTKDGEMVSGAADLRQVSRFMGPFEEDDPFAPKADDEEPQAYEARQRRRLETQAYTRDNIEIVARISVGFRLESIPGEGHTEFGYRPESVERFVIGSPISRFQVVSPLDESEIIKYLPVQLAVNIWREYISKFKLSELFKNNPNTLGAYERIQARIGQHLRQPEVKVWDPFGTETKETQPSREYDILKKRGIQIKNARIAFIRLPREIENQLEKNWVNTWQDRATREKQYVERLKLDYAEAGQKGAEVTFARLVSISLGNLSDENLIPGKTILKRLVQDSIHISSTDPQLNKMTFSDPDRYQELMAYIEKEAQS
jgi:hypothetical protein